METKERELIINGRYIIFFSDKKLNILLQKDIIGYSYELGINKLTISISEYDDIEYLKILERYFKKTLDITIYVSKKPINMNDPIKSNYYSVMFKGCKLEKIFNEGECGSLEESSIDLTFNFANYEVRY
ncbi:MAG: hypothetical protein H7836_14140 [Magnetococcus sp. YQC-3]